MDKRDHIKIGQEIAALRSAKGWTQAHLAEISGLHLRTAQRAEAGKCCSETLMALASALDADVDDLLRVTRQELPVEVDAAPTVHEASRAGFVLSKMTTGKALLDLLANSIAVRLDHDHVVGEEAQLVATFFTSVTGWSAVIRELEAGERVHAAARLHARLVALQERGLRVFAGTQDRPLLVDSGRPVPRPIAVINVRRDVPTERPKRGRRGRPPQSRSLRKGAGS